MNETAWNKTVLSLFPEDICIPLTKITVNRRTAQQYLTTEKKNNQSPENSSRSQLHQHPPKIPASPPINLNPNKLTHPPIPMLIKPSHYHSNTPISPYTTRGDSHSRNSSNRRARTRVSRGEISARAAGMSSGAQRGLPPLLPAVRGKVRCSSGAGLPLR